MTSDERSCVDPPGPPAEDPPAGVDRGDRLHDFRGPGIAVTWSRARCTHAAACIMNLPVVFMPGRRPWIDLERGSAADVARVVERCPTGALHYRRADGGAQEAPPAQNTVTVTHRGPVYVRGDIEIIDESGQRRLTDTRAALCRCGCSEHKPFCDNSHLAAGLDDEGVVRDAGPVSDPGAPDAKLRIRLEAGGPLRIEGPFVLRSADRRTVVPGTRVALCRCGRSRNKPFCDSSHLRARDAGA